MDVFFAKDYRVLLVGPETLGLSKVISELGYPVYSCTSSSEAWREIERQAYAVVVVGEGVQGESALEFLGQVALRLPACSRVLLQDRLPLELLVGPMNRGELYRFLTKASPFGDIVETFEGAVRRSVLVSSNLKLQRESQGLNLEVEVANERLRQQIEMLQNQKESADREQDALPVNLEHSIGLCFRVISTFYPLLGRRTQAVVGICRAMASADCFTPEEKRVLSVCSWMFDLGLIGVSRPLLHKLFACSESCTPEERGDLTNHPILGQTLAAFVDQSPAVGETVRAHHERFDGAGYPDGLAGENIPWTARCLAVAVAFVETGLPKADAVGYLQSESGRGFDPEAVRLFFRTNRVSDLPRNVREVMLAELNPGMQLARGIMSHSGVLLLPEGQELTPVVIDKLNNHNRLNLVTERILVYG